MSEFKTDPELMPIVLKAEGNELKAEEINDGEGRDGNLLDCFSDADSC